MARARPGPASGATRADAEGLRSRGCSRAEWCYGAVDDEASRCCCLQLPLAAGVETSLTTVHGGSLDVTVRHNRGMNTLPLAKTWLAFGEVPAGNLRFSCSRKPLPPPPYSGSGGGP